MSPFEKWAHGDGGFRTVTVTRRFICCEDVCPDCGRTILVAVGTAGEHGQVFRLECLFCPWITDALPDPELVHRPFKRCRDEGEVARRLEELGLEPNPELEGGAFKRCGGELVSASHLWQVGNRQSQARVRNLF